jgi:hypothetical protein
MDGRIDAQQNLLAFIHGSGVKGPGVDDR